MQPAVERMQEALSDISIARLPIVSLLTNVTATPVHTIDQIKPRLLEQITGRVRWTETIGAMIAADVKEIVEIGAGKVLSGLNKRIAPSLVTMNVEKPEELEAFAQVLSA
jgi:[acyl-carrier-protein] S-malonyltransferase